MPYRIKSGIVNGLKTRILVHNVTDSSPRNTNVYIPDEKQPLRKSSARILKTRTVNESLAEYKERGERERFDRFTDDFSMTELCKLCDRSIWEDLMEKDHIMPLSKGGKDIEANIQRICSHCNRSKHSRIHAPKNIKEAKAMKRLLKRSSVGWHYMKEWEIYYQAFNNKLAEELIHPHKPLSLIR